MDSNLQRDLPTSPWQFSLRTLLIVFAMSGLPLSLWRIGGYQVLTSSLVIGLVIGGAISLLGSNKAGATPIIITGTSSFGALAATIFGVYAVGFNVADWDNPLGKCPFGLDDLFWFGFWGALASAGVATVFCWLTKRQPAAASSDQ